MIDKFPNPVRRARRRKAVREVERSRIEKIERDYPLEYTGYKTSAGLKPGVRCRIVHGRKAAAGGRQIELPTGDFFVVAKVNLRPATLPVD